jgi:hypothetical protein
VPGDCVGGVDERSEPIAQPRELGAGEEVLVDDDDRITLHLRRRAGLRLAPLEVQVVARGHGDGPAVVAPHAAL